jgi:FAD/FMN-containing dehydrogenase
MDIQTELTKIFKGDLDTTPETLDFYSHDASLFELRPQIVAFPKDNEDVKALVKFVADNKTAQPDLSITPRSRGTDMSGGAVGESIIMDVSKYMTIVHEITATTAHVQPGKLYREFDLDTIHQQNAILPSYPASRDLASVGGMVANNSGGEKSLQFGKTDNFVTELSVVLSDGNEYTIRPLNRDELNAKIAQGDFEGNLYKKTFELLDANYDEIQAAAPKVSKDSTGYHLWNVWKRDTGIFDLTKLFVGSQGTLGIVTDIHFNLVPRPMHSGTLVCYMKNLDQLGEVIPAVLAHKPATFESFDDNTLFLSFKFFFSFLTKLGLWAWIKLAIQLIPDGFMLIKGIPQLILLIEFNGESVDEVKKKIHTARLDLKRFNFSYMEEDGTEDQSRKFWLMRRESFNLLRSKVKDKHTAPFIDDLVVPPARLTEFLPQLRTIIKKYNLLATIAGHMGDGNFHVIPLMKIEDPKERAKLQPAMKEVNTLVIQYGGSVSGEHNDGMVRGPWLEQMYSPSVLGYMKEMKHLYDPQNIFNPHKKTDANWDFSFSHIREHF